MGRSTNSPAKEEEKRSEDDEGSDTDELDLKTPAAKSTPKTDPDADVSAEDLNFAANDDPNPLKTNGMEEPSMDNAPKVASVPPKEGKKGAPKISNADDDEMVAEKQRSRGRRYKSTGLSGSNAIPDDTSVGGGGLAGNLITPSVKSSRSTSDEAILQEKQRIAGRRKGGTRTAVASVANVSSAASVSTTGGTSLNDASASSIGSNFSGGDSMLNEKLRIAGRGNRGQDDARSVVSRADMIGNDSSDRDQKEKSRTSRDRGAQGLAIAPAIGQAELNYDASVDASKDEPDSFDPKLEVAPGAFRVGAIDEERPGLDRDGTIRIGDSIRKMSKTDVPSIQQDPPDTGLLVQAHVVDDTIVEEKDLGMIVTAEPTAPVSWWRRNQAWLVGSAVLVLVGIILAVVLTSIDLGSSGDDNAPTATPTGFVEGKELETLQIISEAFPNAEPAISDPFTSQYQALQWVTEAKLASLADGSDAYTDTRVLQQYALMTLLFGTNTSDSPWLLSDGWMSDANECSWYGVDCESDDADSIVIGLSLQGNRLNGTIPPDLAILSNSLQHVDLSSNLLSGSIPSEIGDLSSLSNLTLSSNQLTESLPMTLGMLSELLYLDLSSNRLRSEIPTELGTLQKVRSIHMTDNSLLGEIPSEIGMLNQVQDLRFERNTLTSPIPSEIGNLKQLENMNFQGNFLNGPVPTEVGLLQNLLFFNVANNFVVDTIPTEVTQLQNLTTLDLSDNFFEGSVPSDLRSLKRLSSLRLGRNSLIGTLPSLWTVRETLLELDISQNKITGSLPSNLWLLKKLATLNISSNNFYGEIETGIGSLKTLVELDVSDNSFYGDVPTEIGTLSALVSFDLSRSGLSGTIPSQVGMLTSVKLFDLSQNYHVGSIPSELGLLTALTGLGLSQTGIGGRLPSEIGLLTSLSFLDLKLNTFTGTIPSQVGILSSLLYLDLASNQLNGTIPIELMSVTNMQDMDLSNNFIGGPIPPTIANMTSLVTLMLESNAFNGSLPSLDLMKKLEVLAIYYNGLTGLLPSKMPVSLKQLLLQDNSLNGPIPSGWKSLTNLEILDVSYNSISGSLTSELGSMSNLQKLALENSTIIGTLPSQLGFLTKLFVLNLANNQISGTIPSQMAAMKSLEILGMTSNLLDGSIPSEIGLMTNLYSLSFFINIINGTIPSEIGLLSSLVILDLEQNNLSGAIPTEIGMLTNLDALYLSKNSLTGSIPTTLCADSEDTFSYIAVDCDEVACDCCEYCFADSQYPISSQYPSPVSPPPTPGTSSPSPSSTPSTSMSPTRTLGPTVQYTCGSFSSIASFGEELSISRQDDTEQVVDLPFPFLWRGQESINAIYVSANGRVASSPDTFETECLPGTLKIQVASADLNFASIYTTLDGDGFVVSWEEAELFSSTGFPRFSFQLVLYPDGKVEFRWGEADPDFWYVMNSRLCDGSTGMIVPTNGAPFDGNGQTTGVWPTNQCRRFDPIGGGYGQLVPPTIY